MKKIKQLTFVLFIFSVLAFSYPVTQVFAQGGAHVSGNHISGGQCDSSPACNPASGTCCGQCDSNPACNPNDPNGIPCCSLEGNNMTNGSQSHGGFEPPRHPGKTNDLDPRLVEKMKKMGQELEACRSLREEIRGQQQTASSQPPARCQPDTTLQRQLEEANQRLDEICALVTQYPGISAGGQLGSRLLCRNPNVRQSNAHNCAIIEEVFDVIIQQCEVLCTQQIRGSGCGREVGYGNPLIPLDSSE